MLGKNFIRSERVQKPLDCVAVRLNIVLSTNTLYVVTVVIRLKGCQCNTLEAKPEQTQGYPCRRTRACIGKGSLKLRFALSRRIGEHTG